MYGNVICPQGSPKSASKYSNVNYTNKAHIYGYALCVYPHIAALYAHATVDYSSLFPRGAVPRLSNQSKLKCYH